MKVFNLSLTDEDGILLDQWTIADDYEESADDDEAQDQFNFHIIEDESEISKNSEIRDIGESIYRRVHYLAHERG